MKKKMTKLGLFLLLFTLSVNAFAQKVMVQKNNDNVTISNTLFSLDFNLKTGEYSGVDKKTNKTVFTDARFDLDAGHYGWENLQSIYEPKSEEGFEELQKGIVDILPGCQMGLWLPISYCDLQYKPF